MQGVEEIQLTPYVRPEVRYDIVYEPETTVVAAGPPETARDFLTRYDGGGFDLRRLRPIDTDALSRVGLPRAKLAALAGPDGQIHDALTKRAIWSAIRGSDDARAAFDHLWTPFERRASDAALDGARRATPWHRDIDIELRAFKQAPGQCCAAAYRMVRSGDFDSSLASNSAEAHYMAKDEDNVGRISGYRADFEAGNALIDHWLEQQRPLIVGVSWKRPEQTYNRDQVTDHFVVITGRFTDADGRLYYRFTDPADASTDNRFYIDDSSGMLFRPGLAGATSTGRAQYQVTQVRGYKDGLFEEIAWRERGAPR